MSADLRDRLAVAAGDPDRGPDIDAALRRGTRLRRRRQALASAGLVVVAAAVLGGGALLTGLLPQRGIELSPASPAPPTPALGIFDRARTPSDELPTWAPTIESPAIEPREDQSRLAVEAQGLAVYLVPAEAPWDERDPTAIGEAPLLCVVVLDLAEQQHRVSGCGVEVPERGNGAWALSSRGSEQDSVAVVIAGDGLEKARTQEGEVAVEGNVALLVRAHAVLPVTLEGPAGETTVDDGPQLR